MKQQVIRKTLTGDWEAFTFTYDGYSFFVKNYTNSAIFVSFAENDEEDESFKIFAGCGEEIFINKGIVSPALYAKTLYIKGTGEVEVQELDF